MSQLQTSMKSPFGKIYLCSTRRGLNRITWEKQEAPYTASPNNDSPEGTVLVNAVKQLGEYFAGNRKSFDLPLDTDGTEFQKQVWKALSKIPYGKTCSYQQLAKKIKNEKAVRAVGSANGKNPIPIIVPCHRVIAADGSLGGYTGGLKIKTTLLALENRAA